MSNTRIYVYGPITGFTSYPLAMQGFMRAFAAHGLDPISVDISGVGGDTARRLSMGLPPENHESNPESNFLFAMKPTTQMANLVQKHGFRLIGKHAGDVDKIPVDWIMVMEHERFVVVPSTWMRDVVISDLRRAGVSKEVFVSNPGIPPEYTDSSRILASELPPGPFKLIHFCSAATFPERKGTPQAIEAFCQVLKAGLNVELTLVVPEMRRGLKSLLGNMTVRGRDAIRVLTYPQGFPPSHIMNLYREHHALLCPSRAEGAGLQPIEARALGVPVIQTTCTGFADYLPAEMSRLPEYGIVPVNTGELVEAWGDFGRAPHLASEDVAEAIEFCVSNYSDLKNNARIHAAEMSSWSWENTTEKLVKRIVEEMSK